MKTLTAKIIVVGFLGLVSYDLFTWFYGEPGATISAVYLKWTNDRPWLVFGMGYLWGHLTWPQVRK